MEETFRLDKDSFEEDKAKNVEIVKVDASNGMVDYGYKLFVVVVPLVVKGANDGYVGRSVFKKTYDIKRNDLDGRIFDDDNNERKDSISDSIINNNSVYTDKQILNTMFSS